MNSNSFSLPPYALPDIPDFYPPDYIAEYGMFAFVGCYVFWRWEQLRLKYSFPDEMAVLQTWLDENYKHLPEWFTYFDSGVE